MTNDSKISVSLIGDSAQLHQTPNRPYQRWPPTATRRQVRLLYLTGPLYRAHRPCVLQWLTSRAPSRSCATTGSTMSILLPHRDAMHCFPVLSLIPVCAPGRHSQMVAPAVPAIRGVDEYAHSAPVSLHTGGTNSPWSLTAALYHLSSRVPALYQHSAPRPPAAAVC